MQPNQDLIKELPVSFRDKLTGILLSGETVLISLPGAFGEALVITNRRAVVLRENLSSVGNGSGVEAFTYLISDITGADVSKTSTGGVIVIESPKVPQEIEKHAVFFPSFDIDNFTKAGDTLKAILAGAKPAEPVKAAAGASADPDPDDPDGHAKCSECGAQLRGSALFCWNCGVSTGFLCEVCGEHIVAGSSFCTGCGAQAVPDEGKCPGCGRMMPGRQYSFCPWCGQALTTKCYVCGASVSRSWVHCANCGLKLGSDVIDPRTLRAAYARASDEEERTESPIFGQQTAVPAQPPAQAGNASLAANYNDRGKQLFEQDDLEGAIREFKNAVELEPNNSAYHCNLAVALDENDQDEEAKVEYQKTLELNPNDTTALLYIGYMYSENDDQEEASRIWKHLVEIAPGTPDAEEAKENLRHLGAL